MDVDTEVGAEVENTFINKLLGEMKNRFNEMEKLGNNAPSDDECLSSRECSSTSSSDIIQDVDVTNSDHIKIEADIESSSVPVTTVQEEVVENSLSVNEDDNDVDSAVPFRKPNNSIKTKAKNNETNCEVRRTVRAKIHILDENVVLKRSPRRRSRDYNESILQSAIARKEKSYNEGNRPQRLTRQLKPTPKILENLANAAALKLVRNKKDRHKTVEEMVNYISDSESESDSDERKIKRAKYRQGKISKFNGKRNISKDSDCDQSSMQETDDSDKCNKNSVKADDKPQRRSNRLSSRSNEDVANLDDSGELPEASIPEQDECYPADPECSSLEGQLLASQLCLCTRKNQLYASTAEDDILFCTAMDSAGDKIVGCSRVVNAGEVSLVRPSARVPYLILCEVHSNRMLRHNCCPKCGLFCTQGDFVQCDSKHQYHRECQISKGQSECCPHCGLPSPNHNIVISMNSSMKPVFLPLQKAHYTPAKMSFSSPKSECIKGLNIPIIPSEIINLKPVKGENCVKYSIRQIYETIKENNQEKLVDMLGSLESPLSTPLDDIPGGTVLHFAAQNGMLSTVHLLLIAGAELDSLDKEQNTALVSAILAFENSVVKYLIKAGSNISLKGTDGMTALHIAAKLGNLNACEVLLEASVGMKNYINMVDDGGWTPLVWACEHGHFEIVQFLVNKGADVALSDVEHNTALHWAAFSGSEEIAELLLNNKSDVDAVNVHGDSALHIGTRQDMYNFVLVLLTRGAQVDLVNKAGETALDCCQPLSECYTAISLNVNLHTLMSSNKSTLVKTIITNDVSRGREANPIQCINILDDELLPNDYGYVVQNCVTTDDIHIDQRITSMHYCKCESKCLSFECLCCSNSLQCWYNIHGKLVANFNYVDPPMLFECNQLCSCNTITCSNRVVQHGVTQRFQVFKTNTKGWGVRTLRNISKGTFVCEYVGEIISDLEAERRDDDSFMFDLDNREQDSFCIDARHYGNFARFINHGCEPNLVPIRVFIEHHDLHFPRIAFFANRNITSDEELSFDYGEKFWLIKYKSFTCNCGCSNCKYSEESIGETISKYNKRLEEEMAT